MKCSKETLFLFSVVDYTLDKRNVVTGRKCFSNSDFYKLSPQKNFNKFKAVCEDRIVELADFYAFMNKIEDTFANAVRGDIKLSRKSQNYIEALAQSVDGVISPFDEEFPYIYSTVKKMSDIPFLLFYKGDISLLKKLENNVAVIGVLNPEEEIINREAIVVRKLVEGGMNIVSGLAKGCDTVAHKVCLEEKGKTIAILPTPLYQIYPSENKELAYDIVEKGGLLISEYYNKSSGRFEANNRFISRDRLQAMFAKAILLSASYRMGEGDSGSRHAMAKAEEYSLFRAMLYNDELDRSNPQFGLNQDLYIEGKVQILTQSILDAMIKYRVQEQKMMQNFLR